MALISCPDCGKTVSDGAPACIHCGRPREIQSTVPAGQRVPSPRQYETLSAAQSQAPVTDFPFFPVSTHKFIVLALCTFTLYEFYWCYQNWHRIKRASREDLNPFWRAFFAPLWGFTLFGRMRAIASSHGVAAGWSTTLMATFYLVLSMLWRLPDPWWLISFASFVPMIPVQQTAHQVNDRCASFATEDRNETYSGGNVATIIIGGLLLVLGIAGTFIEE